MLNERNFFRRRFRLLLTSSWCAAATLPALAAQPVNPADAPVLPEAAASAPAADLPAPAAPVLAASASSVSAPATPSQNVTINLINRLVQRGVLTKDDAAELIKQAEDDAATARAQAAAAAAAAAAHPVSSASDSAQLAPPPVLFPDAVVPPPVPQTPLPPPLPPELISSPDDTVRVTYIPEVVKAQMRDQIRDEVLAQARIENWAAPRTFPDWVTRIRLFGDIRVRYEGDNFPGGNDNTGAFPNFNAINTGAPFDTSGTIFSPQYDVDQNRIRFRIRARLGVDADLGEGFTAGLRLATGENDSPVTQNQSLGLSNGGQGGNFSKYSIWLDRAFLKYDIGGQPNKDLSLTLGRFDNPFFATNVLWANDLGFDGAVLQAKYEIYKGVTPFLIAGAFPVFNTDFNFATNQPAKFKSEDKWLYAGQTGFNWRINQDFTAKIGGAYYYYQNVSGKLSTPLTPLTTSDAGNTDDTRPAFAQNGNTYMALRDIVPNVNNNFGTIDQFQYYGLATPFHDLAFTGRLDFNHFEPFQISVIGEYVKNLAWNRNNIESLAVNNRSANSASGAIGNYAGGNTAWILMLKLGNVALEKRGDWDINLSYRYLESDSVIDGFNDADFGAPLTGTNLKGFTLGADLALSARVSLGIRWMSADSIAGPPFKSDLIQVDLNGKF